MGLVNCHSANLKQVIPGWLQIIALLLIFTFIADDLNG